jgi:hypothetical protein
MHSSAIVARLILAAALLAIPATRPPVAIAQTGSSSNLLHWPSPTRDSRPWARWWWLGSAVDKPNITALLKQYRDAGFGGMEICPIYGAKGAESRYIDFLSPHWMEMLAHTTAEAGRLGIGVDLTDGTGWPYGGPSVTAADASSRIVLKRYEPVAGTIRESLPAGRVGWVTAVSSTGEQRDLTAQAHDGKLEWTAPPGEWKVYVAVAQSAIQKVKRAAPGGEGNVLDPYSTAALDNYLAGFDRAFAGFPAPMPHAHFHDSFEYYGASWTPQFFAEFTRRRDYDLHSQLPALFGDGDVDTVARVKHDYRETLSDLHLDYIHRWTEWTHRHGGLSRNQAHGAPGNLLDLYSAADIPETEIFGALDDRHLPIQKLASSAAHVTGKPLASAEAFTWLGEHFQVSLADLKPAADYLFLAGINHLVYHGIAYSPADAEWPGWLFYAAVDFAPNGGLWHDLSAFNTYVTRCQSVLQQGRPDNDVLLYFPIHDLWQTVEGLAQPLPIEGTWLWNTPFYAAADLMERHGYCYDQVSDRLLQQARVEKGAILLGHGRYQAVVIPKARLMPPATLSKLVEIAKSGGKVLFWGEPPHDAPGLSRRNAPPPGLPIAGTMRVGDDLDQLLRLAIVRRESMVELGLRFVRRARPDGYDYFIVNRGDTPVRRWVQLGTGAADAALLDPRFGAEGAIASVRKTTDSKAEVYLQLEPGESRILRTTSAGELHGRWWEAWSISDREHLLPGPWKIEFIEGGPALPAPYTTSSLESWTDATDLEARRFAGTARYTIQFEMPAAPATDWMLDLGRVCESARVRVNGRAVATLWCVPFRVPVGRFLRPGRNTLEVEVTNLAANRIADLDRRGLPWKSFHEINFVGKDYKPFDASKWPLRDSGLLGPVRMIPISTTRPNHPL